MANTQLSPTYLAKVEVESIILAIMPLTIRLLIVLKLLKAVGRIKDSYFAGKTCSVLHLSWQLNLDNNKLYFLSSAFLFLSLFSFLASLDQTKHLTGVWFVAAQTNTDIGQENNTR